MSGQLIYQLVDVEFVDRTFEELGTIKVPIGWSKYKELATSGRSRLSNYVYHSYPLIVQFRS